MPLMRWLTGLLRLLFGQWDSRELSYYASTGLDPKLPALQRWQARLKDEAQEPRTEAERVIPVHNYMVILDDKLGLSPEDVIIFTQNAGQAQAVHQQYERELRSRSSGDFWYSMIRHRQLDFFHVVPKVEEPLEGQELDPEAFREMFRRDADSG